MKKLYIAPKASEIVLEIEDVLLTGSIHANIEETGDGEDDVTFESNEKGWSAGEWMYDRD